MKTDYAATNVGQFTDRWRLWTTILAAATMWFGAFTVRVIVKGHDKLGGTLFDAEIAGQRTAISFHENRTVKKIHFRTEGVELKNVHIAPLID